ncbi:hypothetical protein [Lacipirellula limnantheis]|uniref:Uncharacterized protein n=1 Tax=Lacipirellula limnantheis TaxID=2528024 RepID=A0A517TV03_9BACT|nr:hypothetical protein [Lacipirellula limnantheis]QDT72205.1 hypothetical protein I41_13750 [Lacipirellula limnantheis]
MFQTNVRIVVLVLALPMATMAPFGSSRCNGAAAADLDRPATFDLGKGTPLGVGPAKEHSGIVKSRNWPDLFWMHNDSGDEPRIYPVRRSGEVVPSEREPENPGVQIAGAINVDWEDVTVDDRGRVIVGDFGNNRNDRRDLVLYVIPEPAPQAERTTFFKRLFFRYPGQHAFPALANDFNYDCEAIFTIGDAIFLCSKHRSDTLTKLYRLDPESKEEVQTAELIDSFDVHGQATGADATPDGKQIVIATYEDLWLFDVSDPANPLSGPVKRLSFENDDDVEAVCFADEETLIIGAEAAGKIYEVPLAAFVEYKPPQHD